MREYAPPSAAALAWLVRSAAPGGRAASCTRLVGGITADVDRIVLERRDGSALTVVLRRWTRSESWAEGLVTREVAALTALSGVNLPVPELLAHEPTGQEAGVPCLAMTLLPGQVWLSPTDLDGWLADLAQTQAAIHRVPHVSAYRCEGWYDGSQDLSWIADVGLRRAAADAAAVLTDLEQVFAHGDFQHFNVLWEEGAVSGVVDWPESGAGPRGVDVGHCRLNLAVLFHPAAADTFLRYYQNAAGVSVDPGADLRALLSWAPDWLRFIPVQVAGRTAVDLTAMADRVIATIRASLARLG